jgi:phosphatidylserine/phosphatidylglycerophosphate/cardiolipin synthase-like enzyme
MKRSLQLAKSAEKWAPGRIPDQIDGRLLRTGTANFSASGLKRQDSDLIVIESSEAAAAFKRAFDDRFAGGAALSLGVKQETGERGTNAR